MTGLRLSSIVMKIKMQNIDRHFIVFKNFVPHKTQNFDYKTPAWMYRSLTLSFKKDQNIPRDIMLIQQIITGLYFIKQMNAQN